MIAQNIANTIREQIDAEIHISPINDDRLEINLPFRYDDGDGYTFAFVRNDGRWIITDDGDVIGRTSYSGIDITAGARKDRFMRTTEFYGVRESDGELSLPVEDSLFGEAFYSFTQACFEISRLAKLPAEHKKPARKNPFRGRLSRIVHKLSPPAVTVSENWRSESLDPHAIYEVDYCVTGDAGTALIFGVHSDPECWRKVASCLHYKQKEFPFYGLAIFDHGGSAKPRGRAAFDDAGAMTLMDDSRDEIDEFLKKFVG